MFPVSNNSATIIECLLKEADQYHVKIEMQTEVRKITKQETQFQIETNKLGIIQADYICIACGGLPKMEMFNWISNLGHSIQSPVPSLFTFNMPKHPITALMGLSVNNAVIKIKIVGVKYPAPRIKISRENASNTLAENSLRTPNKLGFSEYRLNIKNEL